MLIYSKRNALGIACKEWLEKNKVANEPTSVITWLEMNGLLNEPECEKKIQELRGGKNEN